MKPIEWHRAQFESLAADKLRLPHALLVRGARGIGKVAFARALASCLLCESPLSTGDACGTCPACVWFEAGTHPDFRQIEPAAAAERAEDEEGEGEKEKKKAAIIISVDQIRALPEFINVSSHRGGPKVIVVHPAEMLNVNAGNALLKSLEEPPPRTHFILVTHRPHQVLPTIKSRTRQIPLATPDSRAASSWLASEGVRDPALALAQSGGAPLLALELNDSEYWGARAAFLRQLVSHQLDVLTAADAIRDVPIPSVVAWMQKWSYDLASYQATGSVRYNPDQREAISRIAGSANGLAALRFHREMVKLQRVAHHPLNPRLFVEQVLLAYRDAVQPEGVAA